jgi:hypothetical protein
VRIITRDRIDVDGDPKVSYMHKVWISDISEDVIQEDFFRISTDSESAPISKEQWEEIAATHPPQPTYENSDWGSGLPGRGNQWAAIPAADRR